MTSNSTETDATQTRTNWQVDYDVDPIKIRDPVAEVLGVLEPGDPFVITYRDAVKEAGHYCLTASGAISDRPARARRPVSRQSSRPK